MKKIKTVSIVAMSLIIITVNCFAADKINAKNEMAFAGLEINRLVERSDEYQMLFKGEVVGKSTMSAEKAGDTWRFIDHTIVKNMLIWETTISMASAVDLSPTRTMAAGIMGGQIVDVDVRWKDDWLSGHSVMPRQPNLPQGKITVNRKLPSATIDRSASFILSPIMPFNRKKPYVFKWYNSFENTVRDITFRYLSDEKITVPAGTFETLKVEMTGGEPSQILYLTNDNHRRLVKIEIIGVPFVYELTN